MIEYKHRYNQTGIKIIPILILLLCLSFFGNAQNFISGRITDSLTNEPIPLVNVIINDGKGNIGTTSNIDGRYWIRTWDTIHSISFSHISYKLYTANGGKRVVNVVLTPKSLELKEVVVESDERATEIINNVILNKRKNNYEECCSFSYMTYDKFVVDIDTISKKQNMKAESYIKDTTDYSFFDTMYFFIAESISQRKRLLSSNLDNTEVIASRVAGMRDPFLQMLINQLPITNAYTPHVSIIGKKYLTPFTKESAKRYFFTLEDILHDYPNTSDSVFVISFHPRQNTVFDGLDGMVYVNANSFAIEKILMQPYDRNKNKSSRIIIPEIELAYQMVDSVMMPKSIDFKMVIKITLGENKDNIVVNGRRTMFNIEVNPELKRKEFSRDDLEITASLSRDKNDLIFEKYHITPLTEKELATYKIIDSVLNREKISFDKLIKFATASSSGSIPVSFLSVNIANIVGINKLEGWMLGIGLSTNDKMLKWMSIYGFVDYGFKNKRLRWGGSLTFNLHKYYEMKLVAGYQNRPIVAGSPYLAWKGGNIFNETTWRDFMYMANKFEYATTANLSFESAPFKDLKFRLNLERQRRESVYDYYYGYNPPDVLKKDTVYNTSIGVIFRYRYGEKTTRYSSIRMASKSKYPEILLGYTHYFKGLLGGSQAFNKIEISVTGQNSIGLLSRYGDLAYQFNIGYIDSPVAFTNMFSQYFSYHSGGLYTPNTFSVMRENEFVSDLYANIFITYNTPSIFRVAKIIRPKIGVALNAGWGMIVHGNKSMNHFNPDFPGTINYKIREMNLGYFETGLMLNNIIDLRLINFGFATHYRFGAYTLEKLGNNFSYKLVMAISL